jgi:hypothetical protein
VAIVAEVERPGTVVKLCEIVKEPLLGQAAVERTVDVFGDRPLERDVERLASEFIVLERLGPVIGI